MRRFSWLSLWLNRLPLRWRVALVSFGLLALILITMGIVVSSAEEQVLLSNQLSTLNTQASILINASGVPTNTLSNPLPLSLNRAREIASKAQSLVDKSTLVTILSLDGHPLAQSDKGKFSATIFSSEQEQELLQQVHKQGHASMLMTLPNGQRQLVACYNIFIVADKQSMAYAGGILQLQSSTTVIDSAVSSTRLLLLIAITIGLLVAALLTLPLIRHALRPLAEIERASMRIAGGDLTQRLSEPPTQDELGRLATAFNSMVIRLEHMFARQKQFVADVSHELRTPLTGLGGSLEMLLLEADNGDAVAKRRLMLGMYNEVERMQRLVADLLVLSRLDEGQVKLRKTHIDLCQLLTNVKEQADILAQGQHITLDLPKQPLSIEGDSDQLRRVFLNLIENAIKFTPPGGDITLRALGKQCEDCSLAFIEITDTGLGIPASALPHIFDRFYRVDQARTRTTAQSGSGLGLSIAQGLVHAHGGTITLTSTPNQGTTITLQFPTNQRVGNQVMP
ncbi:sensor histidine kinase [Ktedonobacter racemifer]|uniref:histidine kinase n=1 Tax=Ktedonobacter racemifer DSM 44963 TaxID=485913 RepID=D6TP85_KTERA|nr:sensor histidine kinase [Ktedonobacter racemifer]EFH87441.1 integral membrane sensor signal transduction histidine kinase [Ktedonobacter racemifer DSM 44963]